MYSSARVDSIRFRTGLMLHPDCFGGEHNANAKPPKRHQNRPFFLGCDFCGLASTKPKGDFQNRSLRSRSRGRESSWWESNTLAEDEAPCHRGASSSHTVPVVGPVFASYFVEVSGFGGGLALRRLNGIYYKQRRAWAY